MSRKVLNKWKTCMLTIEKTDTRSCLLQESRNSTFFYTCQSKLLRTCCHGAATLHAFCTTAELILALL